LEKERPLMAGVWAEDFVTAFQKAATAGEKETIDFGRLVVMINPKLRP